MNKTMKVSEILGILKFFNSEENAIFSNKTLSTTVFWRLRKNLQRFQKIQELAAQEEQNINKKYSVYLDDEHSDKCLAYADGTVCIDEKGELILDKEHPLIKDVKGINEGRKVKQIYEKELLNRVTDFNELLDQENDITIDAIKFSDIENATLDFNEINALAWMIEEESENIDEE